MTVRTTQLLSKTPSSIPFILRSGDITTLQSQKVVDRVCRHTITAMYQIDTILRIIGDDDSADKVVALVGEELDKLTTDLDTEKERMRAMVKEHALTERPDYTQPMHVQAQVTSPQADAYFSAVLAMDDIIQEYDALWFARVISGRARSHLAHSLSRRLEKLGRRIMNLRGRAMAAAHKMGKEDEVRAEIPDLDEIDKNSDLMTDTAEDTAAGEKDEKPTPARVSE